MSLHRITVAAPSPSPSVGDSPLGHLFEDPPEIPWLAIAVVMVLGLAATYAVTSY